MPLIFKKLCLNDYQKNYLNLIPNCENITFNRFEKYIKDIGSSNSNIYVIEYNNIIIGTMSLRIENKLNEKVSFINDLYIDNNYISKNIKDKLIGLAIYKSHKKKCNRIVILNNEDEDTFLNKGFTKNDTKFYSLKLD